MKQVLLPIKLSTGVLDGGFLIGDPVDFNTSVTEYELDSGHVVTIEHMPPRATLAAYAVAVVTAEEEANTSYRAWPEFIGNKLMLKDRKMWLGGLNGSQRLHQWDTSFLQELLATRQYNVAVNPPQNTGDGTDVVENEMSTYPYGSTNYWTESNLVPPELASSTDPTLTTADITDFEYIHNQLTPSATWVVEHNLGRKPIVSVIDADGLLMVAEVTHISNDVLHLVFNADKAGTARCV